MSVVELVELEVSPPRETLVEGEVTTLNAIPRGPAGEVLTGRGVTWTTTDPAVAALSSTVGDAVEVAAVGAGQAEIRATAEGASAGSRVTVLPAPSLVLSASDVILTGRQGEVAAPSEVDITNGGSGGISELATEIVYPAAPVDEWLSVTLDGTTVPTAMILRGSAVGLPVGSYEATVRLTGNGAPTGAGLTAELPVTFEVQPPPPSIVLESESVGLNVVFRDPTPASARVGISNGGSGELTGLSAVVAIPTGQPQGWLTATLSDDVAPATLTVTASATGLPAGSYEAQVAIASPVARVSPVFLDVTFRVAVPASGARDRVGAGRP